VSESSAGAIGRREDVRVAVVGPFTGPRAAWGELLTRAMRRHRFPGIAWDPIDDRGDTELARQRAEEIVAAGRHAAVLGHFNSHGAAAALPLYRRVRLPVLLPLSTGAGLLDAAGGVALRWCADDHGQVVALTEFAQRRGARELLVTDDGSTSGGKLALSFLDQVEPPVTVSRLDEENPPATGTIAVCGMHYSAAATACRLRAGGFQGDLLFVDDCAVPEFRDLLGEHGESAYVARLAGGAGRHVEESFAALTGALIAGPALTGTDLLAMIRAHAGLRFTSTGDPQWTEGETGWEVVRLREAFATPNLPPAPAETPELDTIVIGTGIIGVSTAATLAERGHRVAMIGPGPDAPSATRHSGGLVRAYEPDGRARALGIRAFQLLWARPLAESRTYGFHRTESLVLLGPSDVVEAERGVTQLNEAGILAELIDPDEVRRRWPDLRVPDVAAAVWEPGGGYAAAMAAASAYRAHALRQGALDWHAKVNAIRPHQTGVLLETDQGQVVARTAVLATGSRVPDIRTRTNIAIGPTARVKRIRYGHFDARGRALPSMADLVTGMWARPNAEGESFLMGRPVDEWDVVPTGGDALTPDQVDHIRSGGVHRWPWLADAEYLGGRFGADMYGTTGPLVGPVCQDIPLIAAGVFSGGGLKTAPAAAELAADAVRRLL
jgi:glycine/D-amino acid oxidase-like deaminating enzyme